MKKLLLLTKTLLAVALLCVGQNAWALTETFGESKSTTKNTYIIGTSVNIHKDSNPGGAGSYAVFNSKTDKGLKLRTIQSTTPLTLVVNPGYKVTNVTINAYQNNKPTGTITCDSYAVDGATPVAFGSPINIPLNIENASTQTLGTISVEGIEATSSIAFNFTNTDVAQNQIYAYIEVTYEEVTNTKYTKNLAGWTADDVTTTENTVGKWYNSVGITGTKDDAASDKVTGLYINSTKGLRLYANSSSALSNVQTFATLKTDHISNSIVTVDAVWNVGSSSSNSNSPFGTFSFGDLTITQYLRDDGRGSGYQTHIKVNDNDLNIGAGYFERDDEMTIHIKVNSYTGTMTEFYIKKGETTVKELSDLSAEYKTFAAGSDYDKVTVSVKSPSSSSHQTWNYLKSITITEQEQAVYSYTVNAVDEASNVLYKKAEGTVLPSDNSVKVTYDAFYLKGNSLLQADRLSADSKEYNYTFNVTEDNQVFNIVYKDKSYNNVIYYKEAENIGTLTSVGSGNVSVRCSGGKGGYAASDAIITSLPAGKYKVSSFAYGGSGTDLDIYAGTTKVKTFSTESTTLSVNTSDEFTLEETTNIIFKQGGNGGSSPKVLDFIFIQNTSDKEIVGAVDNSTSANGANSSDYIMKPGDTKVFTFQNHGQDYGKNWRIAVKQGETWKANVCADSWDYTAGAATKVSYQVSKDGGETKEDQNWEEFQADMADARVVATLAYGTDGKLAITTTSTGVANGYIYYVDQDVTGLSGDVTVNLSVNESWLQVLSVDQTAVGASISSYGWATFSSDYALDFTGISEFEAYMITGHDGTVVTKTPVTGTVPAGTGLLLKGGEGNYTIPVVASSSTDVSANKLVAGTGESVSAEGGKTKYVLGVSGSDEAEFQKITETSATVAKGKAYLEFVGESLARTLRFAGDITGVDNVEAASEVKAKEGKFIEDNQLFIYKNGVKFNAAGQLVK